MAMRRPWWRNIRWRLALGSMLVALLSAGLLALTAILVINYYYGSEQQSSLSYLAHDKAQSVGILYTHKQSLISTAIVSNTTEPRTSRISVATFLQSVREVMNTPATENSESPEHLYLFFNIQRKLVYPYGIARGSAFVAINSVLNQSGNAHLSNSRDQAKLKLAIANAFNGHASSGLLGKQTPVTTALPFLVEPIFANRREESSGEVIGVVMVTPFSTSIPAFVMAVGLAVLIATPIIAILVAAGAIIYSADHHTPAGKVDERLTYAGFRRL